MDRGEGLVFGFEGVAVAIVGTDGRCGLILVRLACFHLGVGVQRRRGFDIIARLAFAAIAGFLFLRFTLAIAFTFAFFRGFGLGFAFFVLLAFRIVFVGLVGGVVGHAEIAQQLAHHRRECRLVVHAGLRAGERHAGLLRKFRPPDCRDLFRGGRQLAAGQHLAQHELQRVIHRRAALVGHAAIAGPLATLLQGGVEIFRHAIHRNGANRFHARTFGSLEQAPGVFALRHRPRVFAHVMVSHA